MQSSVRDAIRWTGPAVVVLAGLLLLGCATAIAPHGRASYSASLQRAAAPADSLRPGDPRVRQLFIRGLTQAYLDDHARALELFTEALRLAPEEAAILSAAAESYEVLGDVTSALYHARQAQQAAPDNVYYHQQVAQLYMSQGDARRAAETYETLLRRHPDHLDALFDLGRVYTLSGRYLDAVGAYERLREALGPDPSLLRQILQLYDRLDDAGGVERTLQALIDVEPNTAELQRRLGQFYLDQNRPADAVAALREALEASPDDFDTILALADVYRQQGDSVRAETLLDRALDAEDPSPEQQLARAAALYDRADADPEAARSADVLLERVLEATPDQADALVMLGDLRFRAGAYAEAGDLLYRALRENPRDPQLWFRAAAAFLEAGVPARAADVADEGLLLFPGQLPLLSVAAYARMDAYRNDDAIRRFEEALALLAEDTPDDRARESEFLAALGLLHARKQQYALSDSLYGRALEADPDNGVALNNLAFSLAERGHDLPRALDLARRAVALDETNASYLDTLGWVQFKLGRIEEARKWIGRAIESGAAGAAVYDHYGDVHARLGDEDAARTYWRKALEMSPNNRALQEKLEERGL